MSKQYDVNANMIYPLPDKWGKQGWTLINLKLIKKDLFVEALTASYSHVAKKKKGEG